jgi:hypothetical protein
MIPYSETSSTPSQPQKGEETSEKKPINTKLLFVIVALIIGVLFILQTSYGIHEAKHLEPSGAFYLLCYVLLLSLSGYWLQEDSRRHGIKWVYDMGFFLLIAWPLIIPYYLFKTRKSKAFLIIIGYIGLSVGGRLFGRLLGRLF